MTAWGDVKMVSGEEYAALVAERDRLRAELEACEPYIKAGQTPAQRLKASNLSADYWQKVSKELRDHADDLAIRVAASETENVRLRAALSACADVGRKVKAAVAGATPGPWAWNTIGEVGIVSQEDDQSFGMIVDVIAECQWPNAKANARLIAAAPDMAAAILAAGGGE